MPTTSLRHADHVGHSLVCLRRILLLIHQKRPSEWIAIKKEGTGWWFTSFPQRFLPVPEAKLPPFPLANRNVLRLPSYAAWRGGAGTRVGISAKGNRSITWKSHAAALTGKDQAIKGKLELYPPFFRDLSFSLEFSSGLSPLEYAVVLFSVDVQGFFLEHFGSWQGNTLHSGNCTTTGHHLREENQMVFTSSPGRKEVLVEQTDGLN